jgi:hypothetical protein
MKLPKISAHAPCSTSGRTSRHNTRNTPSDARRFCGGTWHSVPDANAHIRRHCNPLSCRLCSPCLGSSCIAPVTDMSHAGAFEKRSLCLQLLHLGCCPVSDKTPAADGFVLPTCISERTKSCVAVTGTTYPNVATTDRAATSQGNAHDSRAHAELSELRDDKEHAVHLSFSEADSSTI